MEGIIQQHTQKELRNCCLAIHRFEHGQALGVKATVKPQQKGDETGAGTDGRRPADLAHLLNNGGQGGHAKAIGWTVRQDTTVGSRSFDLADMIGMNLQVSCLIYPARL